MTTDYGLIVYAVVFVLAFYFVVWLLNRTGGR